MSSRRSPPPPIVVEFDHVPTDAEAAVFFPQRSFSRYLLRRTDAECERWELPRMPWWAVALSLCMPAGGIAYSHWRGNLQGAEFAMVVAFGAAIAMFLFVFTDWLDRSIRALNPVVTVDHGLHELRVEGRAAAIAVADVWEVVSWKLSVENEHELRLNTDGDTVRQATAVVRRGDDFELIFLFHDENDLHCFRWSGFRPRLQRVNAAEQVAAALGVPLRQLPDVAVARDLRPPNRFMKRPDEITRK